MAATTYLPSSFSPSFSEALRIDEAGRSWIFVSGQVGVPLPPTGEPLGFEEETRICFARIRQSLEKLGAGLDTIVNMKVYLTDLSEYGVFSKIRGELFTNNPPTSSAVQVAGLLVGARIEIDAVAYMKS